MANIQTDQSANKSTEEKGTLTNNQFGFEDKRASKLFERLVDAFVIDHMRNRRSLDDSGWRGLPQLARELKISPSSMYGKHGGTGFILSELMSRGLVESRIYTGRRGRGGEVIRLRIAYDRGPIKQLVDTRIALPGEKIGPNIFFPKNRVAILPFLSLSPDPADDYFADGLTEELIGKLSQIKGLEVIARTSTMAFKNEKKTIEEIGARLRAGTLLEGSIRKAGNKFRVSVQLIDAKTSGHLWSATYDRIVGDIFAVQTDIAERLVDSLHVQLLSSERRAVEQKPTRNEAAYLLFLKGRQIWNRSGLEDIRKAIEYFDRSVKTDPDFALGYAGLADCYSVLDWDWHIEADLNRGKTRMMVARALELDPRLAEAHAQNASLMQIDYMLKEADAEFRTATRLKPSYSKAHQWYFDLLLAQQRWDEAQKEIEEAVKLDPLSAVIAMNHARFYLAKRNYSKATELNRKAVDLDPTYVISHAWLIHCYARREMFNEAQEEASIVGSLLEGTYPFIKEAMKVRLAYFRNDTKTVARLLPEIEEHKEESGETDHSLAGLHFYLGHDDVGFELLEKAFSKKEAGILSFISWDEKLDSIRSDSRYVNLLNRAGLADQVELGSG